MNSVNFITTKDVIKSEQSDDADVDTNVTEPTTSIQPQADVSDNILTPIEGLNERLDAYGNAKLILSDNYYEGGRPKGRLNAFKDSIAKVADNMQILADLNLNEFDFLSIEDKQRLDALKPLAKELIKLNMNDISSAERRTIAVEKRYAALTNQLANEFVDIIGKHVEKQLGKKITSSKPRISGVSTDAIADIQEEIEALFENATLDNIDQIYADAVAKYVFNIGIYTGITDAINDAYLNKIESLEKDLSFENINEGSVLINIQPVGTNKRLNQNFIFDSKDETNRTVTLYNPVRKKNFTFTEEELKEKFMLPRDENAPIEEMNVTPIIKENIKSTESNITDLAKNPDVLDQIEEESENLSPEERLDKIKNIFNQC